MSKKFKPFWIIFAMSLILIVAGAAIFAVSYPYKEGITTVVRDKFKHSVSIDESVDANDVTKIIVSDVDNLKIETHAEETVRFDIDYSYVSVGFTKRNIGMTKENGIVKVQASYWSMISIFNYTINCDAVLYIPASYDGKLDINMTSGSLELKADNTFSDADIDITSGKIEGKLACDKLTLDMTSGKMILNLSTNALDAELTSGAADLTLDKAIAFNANLTSGRLNVTMPYDSEIGIKASMTSGVLHNFYFPNLNEKLTSSFSNNSPVGKDIRLSMTSGKVTLNKSV